jgi:hypothetical protein
MRTGEQANRRTGEQANRRTGEQANQSEEGPVLAGDCLLAQSTEGPLTRKLPLKPAESAAIYDPSKTSKHCSISLLTMLLTWVNITMIYLWAYPIWVKTRLIYRISVSGSE